jgi:arsenical pump membrane protein
MLLPWIAACAVTALVVGLAFRPGPGQPAIAATRSVRLGIGAVATIMAAAAVVALTDPAVPVLAIGLVATAAARVRPQLAVRSLSLLFCATVALGAAARHWPGAAVALASSGPWTTAVGAAATSVVVNNLPAAVLLSAAPPAHPAALLLGLDLGPNLAVTGSLSAVLWLQTARSIGARPSVLTYTRLGLLLVPASLVAALLALLAVRG